MATPRPPPEPTDAMLEEATVWFIHCNEGELNAAGRERFLEWLRRSPEHIRAYVEIAAVWQDAGRLCAPKAMELEALIAQARVERNVLELTPSQSGMTAAAIAENTSRPPATWMRFSLVAAVALFAIGVGYWFLTLSGTYETGIGEQRTIVLDDGSTIALNARSSVRVHYGDNERGVDLLNGQALFQVQKDASRPFVVLSNGARIRAVGTQFDVYRKATGTTVTVIEGRVAITPNARVISGEGSIVSAQPDSDRTTTGAAVVVQPLDLSVDEVLLVAGQQLVVAPLLVSRPTQVDVAAVTAWTQRKLVFDDVLLGEVIEEFNRYNTRQIVVEDSLLAEYHIRGTFQATDPDRLVEFLRDRFGVEVVEEDGKIHISRH
ncbi:MAG: FecR family protein [Steroidobacteraceae bacterium]